jgi:uncharacterized ferredoxin-like protein
MLQTENDIKLKALDHIAESICVAAVTAPKGKGINKIVTAIAKGDTVKQLSDKMLQIQKEQGGSESFIRDSGNLNGISHVVLIGTKLGAIDLKACGLCGYKDCASKPKEAVCSLNTIDLGIAIGSAISAAADNRVDNRIMFSIGQAAIALGLLGNDVKIAMGIPLSVSGKNPFFDRK